MITILQIQKFNYSTIKHLPYIIFFAIRQIMIRDFFWLVLAFVIRYSFECHSSCQNRLKTCFISHVFVMHGRFHKYSTFFLSFFIFSHTTFTQVSIWWLCCFLRLYIGTNSHFRLPKCKFSIKHHWLTISGAGTGEMPETN